MSKLAFVDIDNVLAENIEREFQARQFTDSRFVPESGIIPSIVYRDAWQKIFYSERAFYKPEWIALDTLIDGAKEALETLCYDGGYLIRFLTSRPETLRDATGEWLYDHGILFFMESRPALTMKETAFTQPPPHHTYTRIWKAGMIQTLTALYGATDVLVIDDSEDVIQAVKQYGAGSAKLRCVASLHEAVEMLESEREG